MCVIKNLGEVEEGLGEDSIVRCMSVKDVFIGWVLFNVVIFVKVVVLNIEYDCNKSVDCVDCKDDVVNDEVEQEFKSEDFVFELSYVRIGKY